MTRETRFRAATSAVAQPTWERADTTWVIGLFLLTTAASALLSSLLFGRIPHVQDSIAQLFQARIFAGGHLVAPAPPIAEFFQYHHMIIAEGRWYSQYPPGHALSLLPGIWAGAPWLVNPLLGGVGVAATYLLGMETVGRSAARLGASLALISPFLLLMSAEFMAHATTFAALTLFLVLHLRAARTGSRLAAWGSMVVLAWGILARPFTAFGFVVPVLIFAIWRWSRREPQAPGRIPLALVTLVTGVLLGGAVMLGYNAATTGSPFRFGYEELYGSSHGIGFGKGTWGPPHTFGRGLLGFFRQIESLHGRLFAWPIGSLWPLLLGIGPGLLLGRRLFLLSIPLSLGFVHVFYWYRDDCFGPRYWYEGMGPILLLSAVGLLRLRGWMSRLLVGATANSRVRARARGRDSTPPSSSRSTAPPRPRPAPAPRPRPAPLAATAISLTALLAVMVSGFVWGWPALFRAPAYALGQPPESAYRQASYFAHFGPQYWGVGPNLGRVVEAQVSEPALVFCAFIEEPIDDISVQFLWFGSAFAHEDPYLEHARVIYARDLGPRNEELIARFPGRAIYRYVGTIQTGTLTKVR